MRYTILLLAVLGGRYVSGQDTLQAAHSAGQDFTEIRRQKFIDRYENVFMTKEPTRHLFKAGAMPFGNRPNSLDFYSGSDLSLNLTRWSLGYEFKLTPSFSVGLDAFGTAGASRGIASGGVLRFRGSVNIAGQIRWYYDMKKRIEQGVSANNFSGNYIGLIYDHYYEYNPTYRQVTPRIGIEYGIQRRFFNSGFADLAIGVYQNFEGRLRRGDAYSGGVNELNHFIREPEWNLASRATVGFAFGDWKRKSNLPYCEVLRCDEEVKSQFTVSWPLINIGIYQQTLSGMVGYERKLLPSFSMKLQAYAFLNSMARDTGPRTTYSDLASDIQFRYYLRQARARRKGVGGYDFSGLYMGPMAEYSLFRASGNYLGSTDRRRLESLRAGVTIGYQRTLFRNVYIDLNGGYLWNIRTSGNISKMPGATFRMGFGLRF